MNPVRFNLKDKSANSTLIYLLFRYDTNRIKISTGINIPVKHWNDKKQMVKELAGYFEYPAYNAKLNRMKHDISKTYSYFQIRGEKPSILEFKEKFKEIHLGIEDTSNKSIYVKQYLVEFFDSPDMTKSMKGAYQQLLKVLDHVKDIKVLQFKDLKRDKLDEFVNIMFHTFGYSNQQMIKLQKKLIAICNRALDDGLEVHKDVSKSEWRVVKANSETGIAYSKEEVKRIIEAEIPDKYVFVRDRLIIGLNTGQRISDFMKLNITNVVEKKDGNYWDFIQQKTGNRIVVKVNKACQAILDKYNGYPPVMAHQTFNKLVKIVCRYAKIDREIIKYSYDHKGKIIESKTTRTPAWQITTSHDCRRTFATFMHDDNEPIGKIKHFTGHKTIQSLEKYLRIDPNLVSNNLEYDIFE